MARAMTTDSERPTHDSGMVERIVDAVVRETWGYPGPSAPVVRSVRKGVTAALEVAGIEELRKENGWQLIETAPKDGTDILVWFDAATVPVVHIAWYRSAQAWEESGQYCGGWDSLEDWEGWWSYTRGSVTQEKLEGYSAPTHWMPVPEPPRAALSRE